MDLEEASVRSNLALSQKKLIHELDGELYDESEEYRALCTDVVCIDVVKSMPYFYAPLMYRGCMNSLAHRTRSHSNSSTTRFVMANWMRHLV